MTFAELMRVCNVRDSSTMKHHLTKLGRLVRKLENGSYALTPIGYEAFKLLEQLEESISRLIPLVSSPRPLIIIKPSKRHLLLLPATMAAPAIALGITLNPYAAIPPAIGLCIALLYPLISGSKIVLNRKELNNRSTLNDPRQERTQDPRQDRRRRNRTQHTPQPPRTNQTHNHTKHRRRNQNLRNRLRTQNHSRRTNSRHRKNTQTN